MVGFPWHATGIYCSVVSAFLELHHHHKALNHPTVYELMEHFYLQHPPLYKHFDLWDIECSLSLLESCAPVSSSSDFKLAWKTATLLVFITAKCYFNSTLLHIDKISTFFFSDFCYFFLHLWVEFIDWAIFHLKFILNDIPMLFFALYFIWRLWYSVLSLLERSCMHLGYPLCFLVIIGSTCKFVPKQFLLE